jgi:hypothetical protein
LPEIVKAYYEQFQDCNEGEKAKSLSQLLTEVTLALLTIPKLSFGQISGLKNKLSKAAEKVVQKPQSHHLVPKKAMKLIEKNPNLAKLNRDHPMLVIQAKDLEAHKGYQTWHRIYDDKLVTWLGDHPKATREEFFKFLHGLNQEAEVASRIPGVNLKGINFEELFKP